MLPLREETLAAAREWVEKLRSSNSSNINGVLLAAKARQYILFCLCLSVEKLISCQADLSDRRVVSPKAGAELAASLGLQYFESSAKDQTGVEVKILQSPSQFSAFYFDIFWPAPILKSWIVHQEPFFYLANEWHKLHGEQAAAMAEIAWDHIWSYLIIFDHIWS